ncbi:helix-turn-helix transcriptional regulator [Saccharibacillus sp. CPCC 101409]|uniref:helix-turn-helix domain-containing protein n=1 Tax=Saccharibacillus sp. CPCC 101409 TaxID=3058041 RepID=UPI0026712A47|nr:helix-turn-helix transcriptional regulator [Saccharibacillus sp. CPCC 101409]MDO3409807.1 helix-turn-helix transcriptional regulator [Saccharibacillus sp. CPCC 101409]
MKTYRSSSALGEFIRSRRQKLSPADSGIEPLPGRRRTPGLRREEVAYLANMSVTYYTWLEQGKELNPSQDILLSIGRALRLSDSEQHYLLSLAETVPVAEPVADARTDIPLLRALAGQLRYPSFITDDSTQVLAWNRSAELLLADFGRLPEEDRHILHLVFENGDFRSRLVNWEQFARYTAAWVRTIFERSRRSAGYMERFERLNRENEDFRRCWDRFEVKQKHVTTLTFRQPIPDTGGERELVFDVHSAGRIDQDPSLIWTIFVPAADTDTEEWLTALTEQSGDPFLPKENKR